MAACRLQPIEFGVVAMEKRKGLIALGTTELQGVERIVVGNGILKGRWFAYE